MPSVALVVVWLLCLALLLGGCPGGEAQTLADAVNQLGNITAITSAMFALGISLGPDFQGTLLAPSDAAMGAVPEDVLANTTLLNSIIEYHVLPTISELPAAPAVVPTNLTGQNMTINVVNSTGSARQYFFLSAVSAPGQGNSSDCAPFSSGRATVCKIDTVLIPPRNTLLKYIRSNPDLQGLLNLTDTFGLTDALFDADNAITLLAPNNVALQEFLATAPLSTDNQELFSQVVFTLLGHVLYNTTVPFALGTADPNTTYTFTTLVDARLGRDAQLLEVAPGAGMVTSIVDGVRTDPAIVVLADKIAGKSYVTIIDKVLDTGVFGTPEPAPSPSPTTGGNHTISSPSPVLSTPTSPAPTLPLGTITIALSIPCTQKAEDKGIQELFTNQLKDVMATYFNVTAQAITVANMTLYPFFEPQRLLVVRLTVKASWPAGDAATPAFLAQQISNLQKDEGDALPASKAQALDTIGGTKVSVASVDANLGSTVLVSSSPAAPPISRPAPAPPAPAPPAPANTVTSVAISLQASVPATPSLATNATLLQQFSGDLQAALSGYFQVAPSDVVMQAEPSTTKTQRRLQQAQATVLANVTITASIAAGDTATPALLAQQLTQMQQQPSGVLPDSMVGTYNIDKQKVAFTVLDASQLDRIRLTGQPSPTGFQSPSSPPLVSPAPSHVSSQSLDSGAIAGIATAAVLGTAAVVAVAVVILRRRRQRKHGPASWDGARVVLADSHTTSEGLSGKAGSPTAPTVMGLPRGELFMLTTASNYTWTSTAALPASQRLQAVQAGINDTQMDTLLHEQASSTSTVGMTRAGMHCSAVQLSQPELQQQVLLLTDGLLGRGATALVFKCVWPSRFGPDALLAAKVLQNGYEPDISVLSSFSYEASLLAVLRHPNVVKLYGYCLEPPTVCLILELLPCSLKDVLYKQPAGAASGSKPTSQAVSQKSIALSQQSIASASHSSSSLRLPSSATAGGPGKAASHGADAKRHGAFNVTAGARCSAELQAGRPAALPDIVRISTDVAAGLAFLHGQQLPSAASAHAHDGRLQPTQYSRDGRVVHRDLKPANILLNSLGVAKISDFGLAREHDHTTFATVHLGAGTLPYMAPELLMSSQAGVAGPVCTNRVDIYSLGMIMWELLAGQQPWRGMAPTSIIAAVMNRRRLPLPGADSSGHLEDREHAVVDVAWQHGSLPAHSHPDLPKFCNIIQACWQHRELRRPTAAALHGMLAAMLQDVER